MANVIGLGVQFTANASGMTKGLSEADRAIKNLAQQASSAARLFDSFASSSAAAAQTQQQVATDVAFLGSAFRTGQISAEEYAAELRAIVSSANGASQAFAEGARITEQVATAEERRAADLQKLQRLLEQGAITEETAARARAQISGENARAAQAAAQAERERAALLQEAARVTDQVATEQEKRQASLERLNAFLGQGLISEETYQRAVAQTSGANAAAAETESNRRALLEEGRRVAESVATAEEKRSATLNRLAQLLEQGAISQQTYERAAADASGANESAAKAESARAQALARAAQITQANLTPSQKYDQEVQELNQHLQAGRISQETYNTALNKAQQSFAKAESAARKYDSAADAAGTGNNLAFNELSGILSALPGPIGNVAGRLSGLSSAGEGLGRVFSGGLSQGFGSLASSAAGLISPMTAGLAAVAAFGAGAAAVASGLVELEGRVERLGFAAEQLGVDFQAIQTLDEAARRTGVSFDELTNGLQKFAVKLDESRDSSSGAAKALQELGVSQEQLAGLSLPQQADLVATALAGIEDPARRAALQMELLGRSGENVRRGLSAIDESSNSLDKFNARISDIDRERIASLGTAFDDVQTAIMGLGQNLITPLAGLAEGISGGLSSAISGLNAVIAPLGDIIAPFATAIGVVIEVVGNSIGIIGTLIGTALQPAAAVFQILGQVVEFFADGIRAANDAMNSVLQPLQDFFSFDEQVESFSEGLEWLSSVFERVGNIVSKAVQNVIDYVTQLAQKILEIPVLGTVLVKFSELVSAAFEKIQRTLAALKDGVEFFLGSAEEFVGVEQQVQGVAEGINGLSIDPPDGFENWQSTLGDARSALNKVIEESAQFGQAGFDAAYQFQQALAELQRQAEAGILNETAYQQEVDKATEAYRSQIDTIKEAAAEEERKAEAARRSAEAAIEADKKRVDSLLERQRIDNEFGGDAKRAEAAKNVLAIENEIARAEAELQAARDSGDTAAANAAAARIAQLDQVAARERDIASGVAQQREEADKKAMQAVEERKRAEEQKAKQVAALEQQYAERLADIQADRLDALSRRSNEALAGNDIRSSAGASQFLALATGREDPAIDEYRKQLRELQDIKREIAKANAAPVEIAG